MKPEVLGPTFKKVILMLATAALGGGAVAVSSRGDAADPGPETNKRLIALERDSAVTSTKVEAIDKRTGRMENTLDAIRDHLMKEKK